jgi:tRNA G18 (ribose-2'-O)-methylase SpoU
VPWVPIDDPRDPRIASFVGRRDRELARRVAPGGRGMFIAEGDVVAARAIRAGYELRAVLVDATCPDPLPSGMDAGVPVYAAAPVVLQRITGLGVHRGLLACFERRQPLPAAEVLGR